MKHCVLLVDGSRFPKATLIGVLIKLEVFQVLPVFPVRLLKETSPRELHDSGLILSDIARENNVVAAGATQSRATVEEINTVVELVMGKFREVVLGHDRHTSVGDIQGDFRVGEDKGTIHGSRIREQSEGCLCVGNSVDWGTVDQNQPSAVELCAPLVYFCPGGARVHGRKNKVAVFGDETKTGRPMSLEVAFREVEAGFERATVWVRQHVNHFHIPRAYEVLVDNLHGEVFPSEFWRWWELGLRSFCSENVGVIRDS